MKVIGMWWYHGRSSFHPVLYGPNSEKSKTKIHVCVHCFASLSCIQMLPKHSFARGNKPTSCSVWFTYRLFHRGADSFTTLYAAKQLRSETKHATRHTPTDFFVLLHLFQALKYSHWKRLPYPLNMNDCTCDFKGNIKHGNVENIK